MAGADFRGETGGKDKTVCVGPGDPVTSFHPDFDFQHRLSQGGHRIHAPDR